MPRSVNSNESTIKEKGREKKTRLKSLKPPPFPPIPRHLLSDSNKSTASRSTYSSAIKIWVVVVLLAVQLELADAQRPPNQSPINTTSISPQSVQNVSNNASSTLSANISPSSYFSTYQTALVTLTPERNYGRSIQYPLFLSTHESHIMFGLFILISTPEASHGYRLHPDLEAGVPPRTNGVFHQWRNMESHHQLSRSYLVPLGL